MVPSDKQRYTILVADDSEMNRSILRSMLEESYDIIEAEDGLQAVALLQQMEQEISLVLLDIVMPNMDGFGVLSCGFRGVVIRNAVLLPWLFSLLIRKKWIAALPCIFVEACMVWTLYGLGACAAVTAGMAAAGFAGKVYAAGREAA